MGKRIIGAGLVGGCIGVIAQILITLLGNFISDPSLVILLTMFLVAIISFILIIIDVYSKILQIGYIGAELPVSGLMCGASNITAMTRKAGAPAGVAFRKGFGMVGAVAYSSLVISILIGIVTFFITK
jgi:hypothetical protein